MYLQDRALYQFDNETASLFHGLHFIAEATSNGFALYTPEEWEIPGSEPHLVVDPQGRLLRHGAWTGYTAEELVLVREAAVDDSAAHGSLTDFSRPHRCDHGTKPIVHP